MHCGANLPYKQLFHFPIHYATHGKRLAHGHRILLLAEDFEMMRLTPDFETLRLTCDFKTLR